MRLNGRASVQKLSGWLWNRFLLQLLKPQMSRLFRTKSFLTFRQLQSVFFLKLLFDMIRTQSKNILPVYSVLQNYFIYSRVKAFEILHGATTPVASMKNRIEVISIHLIRKTFPVFQVIFTLVIKKITRKTMLT